MEMTQKAINGEKLKMKTVKEKVLSVFEVFKEVRLAVEDAEAAAIAHLLQSASDAPRQVQLAALQTVPNRLAQMDDVLGAALAGAPEDFSVMNSALAVAECNRQTDLLRPLLEPPPPQLARLAQNPRDVESGYLDDLLDRLAHIKLPDGTLSG